ncbi:hypothetical protein MLD38_031888 [Melastoma candidum]|uniref:Uncharacterized protein n=1 Tax=Melastoma candidum TaxID=119954 RepID=A0ACB9MQN4_9MYRT|nr:hypothetical protein MLD38_031888 [Melastoma candidum]
MSSSPRITAFVFLALLFRLLLSVRAMEENPRLVEESMLMKISGRRSLRLHKGLFPHYEAADDFSWNGSEGGGAGARKMMSLLRDDGEVKKGSGTREDGAGASQGKQSSIWEDADGGRRGFMGNTAKVGLGVRHRLRLRSKRKGQDVITGGDHLARSLSQNHHRASSDQEKEEMMNLMHRDYHFFARHPPPINN